jgi:hypothetical protein
VRLRRPRLSNAELNDAARHYDGPTRPYDIVKEVCIASAAVVLLALALAFVFSSPDESPSTIAQWSRQMPADFVTTALSELDGTSETATYGPPYNNGTAEQQHILFIHIETWLGVTHPVNAAQAYVLAPLRMIPDDPTVQSALKTYLAAPVKTQTAWTTAYGNALNKATTAGGGLAVPAGAYGPVGTMMSSLLALAQSGGLDGDLLANKQYYQTDYTAPLLFLEDGSVLTDRATAQHLLGTQWGMMNETGSYPGQVWLWLYTFWYQVGPIGSSSNADFLAGAIMGLLSLGLILIPFLPGVRSIPRVIPIYKIIWRNYYRDHPAS